MTIQRNEIHSNKVDEWERSNAASVPVDELPSLYAKAIQAVEQRSLVTLSSITVVVVLDRAIHQAMEKYPFLSDVKLSSDGVDFDALLKKAGVTSQDQKLALRELLIDLLNVLGNITADILTASLHKELSDVTTERKLTMATQRTLRTMNTAKKGQGHK